MMERSEAHFVRVYKAKVTNEQTQVDEEVWKVDPGVVKATPEDMITWRPDGTDITIYFPGGEVFLVDQLAISNDQQQTLTVRLDAKGGAYPYAVFCHSGDDFAVGSRHPIIIIERGD